MNIKERLTLLKAGYTKEEINAMLDEEKAAPVEEAAPQEASNDVNDFMSVVTALAEEVKGMRKAMQKENIKNTEIEGTGNLQEQADKILRAMINPAEEKE